MGTLGTTKRHSNRMMVALWLLCFLLDVSHASSLQPPLLKLACSTCRTNTSITFKWIHNDPSVAWYEVNFIKTAEFVASGNTADLCPLGQACAANKWQSFKVDDWNTMRTKQNPIVQPTVGCSVFNIDKCSSDKQHTQNLEFSTTYTFRARSCSSSNICSLYSPEVTIATGQNAGDMPQSSMFCSVIGTCSGVVPYVAVNGQQKFISMKNEFDVEMMKEFLIEHRTETSAIAFVGARSPGHWALGLANVKHFKTQSIVPSPFRKDIVWMERQIADGSIAFTAMAATPAQGQDRKWVLVSGKGSGISDQRFVVETGVDPPLTWAQLNALSGYYITSIGTDENEWFVIASKGVCDLPAKCEQKYVRSTSQNFPLTEVNGMYNQGYRVTASAFRAGTWWIVLMKNSGFSDQEFFMFTDFPTETDLQSFQSQGYRVTSTAGNTTNWVVTLSKVATYGEPCLKECHNGGELDDTTCTCKCKTPWFGDTDLGGKKGFGCTIKPEPCVLGIFNEYRQCPVECGGDHQRRNRSIVRPAMYGGMSCEVVSCKMNQKLFVEPAEQPEPDTYKFETYLRSDASAPLDAKTLLNEKGLNAVHKHQELGTWFSLYLHWLDQFDGANATYCNEQVAANAAIRPSWDLSYLDFKHPLRCGTKGCNGAPVVKVAVNSTHLYRFRRGRGVDYKAKPADKSMYMQSGVTHPFHRQLLSDGSLRDLWNECGSDTGCWERKPYSGLERETLLQIQRPETSFIVDATASFDEKDPMTILSVKILNNGEKGEIRLEGAIDLNVGEGFRITEALCSEVDGNHIVKAISNDFTFIEFDISQETGTVLTDKECGNGGQATPTIQVPIEPAFNIAWSVSAYSPELDVTPIINGRQRYLWIPSPVQPKFIGVDEDFVKERIPEARLEQIGNGDYDAGMALALRLIKIVEFKDVELFGTFQIDVSIQDLGTATEKPQTGRTLIPIVINNCEPPEVRIQWEPRRVNPSDKTIIKGTVWFYGMGDLRRAPNATRQMWETNKMSLKLTWRSIAAPGMHVLKESDDMNWNGTKLVQTFAQLQTWEGLQLSNFIVRKRKMDPGFYTFRFTAWDLCSAGRPPIQTDLTIEVNTPPEGGIMEISHRFVTVFNESVDMLMRGWNDTDGDLPLTYYYKYMLNEGKGFKTSQKVDCDVYDVDEETMCEEVPVSAQPPSLFSNSTAMFPAGEVVVVGYIVDSHGASTRWVWLEDMTIANISVWAPPMNSSEKMALLKAQSDALLESGNATSDPDAAMASMNSIVGLLNDANASIACCGGHGNCTLEPEGCDYPNDLLCAVTACSCENDWEGEFCETPSGKLKKEKMEMRAKMLTGLSGAANATIGSNSSNNTAGAAEGMSKTLQKTTSGKGELGGNSTSGATEMLASLVGAAASGEGAMSPDTGGPAMGAISNLVEEANDGGDGGAGALGDNLADSLIQLGVSMMSQNVPGEKSIALATAGIQMSTQIQTLDGLSGLKFEVVAENNCTVGPQFEFPVALLGHEVDTSQPMALIGQKWEKNRYGAGNVTKTNVSQAPAPSPWFGDWSPSPSIDASNNETNSTGGGRSKKKVKRGLSGMGLNQRIKNLQYGSHIAFTMPLKPPFPGGLRASKCQYMDKKTQKFSQDGTFAIGMTRTKRCGVTQYSMICATSHLTDFKPEVEDAVPEMNTPDPVGDAGALGSLAGDAIHVPLILGILTMLNFWGIYYGIKNDRKDKEMYEAYMRIEFLKKGILNGDINENDSFLDMCYQQLRATHKILSFIKPPISNAVIFRRYERVVCTYAHFLASLAVSSLFYGKDPNSMPKKIAKAIITSILMFPTSTLFPSSFINIHSVTSKTYRKDEQVLDYADVLELADERLPDDFVKSGVGRDPHQERKAKEKAEAQRQAEIEKAKAEEHDAEFGILTGGVKKSTKVSPESESKSALNWDVSDEEKEDDGDSAEYTSEGESSEDEVIKAQTPLMARIALAKRQKKFGDKGGAGAAHAMVLMAQRKAKQQKRGKIKATDHIHARKIAMLAAFNKIGSTAGSTDNESKEGATEKKAPTKGVLDPNGPPPTKENMDEYELSHYKKIVMKYTEEEILEELDRRGIEPHRRLAKKTRLMEQLKEVTVDETTMTPEEIQNAMAEMKEFTEDELADMLWDHDVEPESFLVKHHELLQQLIKAIDCVNLEDEALRANLRKLSEEELIEEITKRKLVPKEILAPKGDLEQQLLDATDFSSMKPEEAAKEKVKINKMTQVKLRLALEEKKIEPKRVPGTKKDYVKQLKNHLDGIQDDVEELKACVPFWNDDRLVKEMTARNVDPAIEIAPKKDLVKQVFDIQATDDMDEKAKKSLSKKISKMTVVELIAFLEENSIEPKNITCKTNVLRSQMIDIFDGAYKDDLENTEKEMSERRIKRMTLRQIEAAIKDRGAEPEYADAKRSVLFQQLNDSTDWKGQFHTEADRASRLALMKKMSVLELKYELQKKGKKPKNVLPKRKVMLVQLNQLIVSERYKRKMARKSVLDTKMDPADIDTTLVDPIDIEYEIELLEEIGEVHREEKCPVRCHKMAKKEDMRWLLLVRRMEFELYVGMGAEKKVQFYAICIAITAFCAFLIFMNLLFGVLFEPDQSMGWMLSCLQTLIQGAILYEPIGICAGVLMSSKLPLLWKLLNGHGDQVDKELDAAILVQTTWRSKKEHRRYMAMLKDKRGAQQAMADARQAEIDKFKAKHEREIEAATKIQAFMRGCWDRERCVHIRREIKARTLRFRQERRMRIMARIKGQAAASYAMSLVDKKADEERRRLEREAYLAALEAKKDAARDFLAMKVAEGRMIAESNDAMISNFSSNRKKNRNRSRSGSGSAVVPKAARRRQGRTKKIKF